MKHESKYQPLDLHQLDRHLHHKSKPEVVDAFKRERDNFRRMVPELKHHKEYQDKFVAIHNNEVVGASQDRLDLYLEVAKKYPSGTFFIGKVYPPKKS